MAECNEDLRIAGKAYPRTCAKCGLGPCKIYSNEKVRLDARVDDPENAARVVHQHAIFQLGSAARKNDQSAKDTWFDIAVALERAWPSLDKSENRS